MKFRQAVVVPLFIVALSSCSGGNDCFVADTVELLKKIQVRDKTFFVYLRISGFNEKEYFYELYDKQIRFDDCGQSETVPVSDVHVDTSSGQPARLIVRDGKLELLTVDNDRINTDLKRIPIEVVTMQRHTTPAGNRHD